MRNIEIVVAKSRAERMRAVRAAAARMMADEPGSMSLMERCDLDRLRAAVGRGLTGSIRFIYGDLGVVRSALDLSALPERADAVLVVAGERLANELRLALTPAAGRA